MSIVIIVLVAYVRHTAIVVVALVTLYGAHTYRHFGQQRVVAVVSWLACACILTRFVHFFDLLYFAADEALKKSHATLRKCHEMFDRIICVKYKKTTTNRLLVV